MAKRTGVETFGMVVMASEWPNNPELHPVKTHTFAAFVHEKPDGQMECHLISWLPKSGIIDGFLQIGTNYCLEDSLYWSFDGGMAVYAWHAYEIKCVLFESALRRINALRAGDYRYFFFGTGPRNLNCTHALSGLDILPPPDIKLAIYGVDAGRACLDRMGPWSWKAPDPGKYEKVLDLPPEVKWLEYGAPERAAKAINPRQYYTNLAKDLPNRLDIDE